ncbi:MAG TPA: hypothetical protein VF074_07930 [Pyrinomonadaceae bacterium]
MVTQKWLGESPELAAGTPIVAENLRAAQTIYVAAMLEELKLFQALDRLVDLFQKGILAVNRRSSGRSLYNYWRESPLRLSESDRRTLFSSTLGIAGGADGGRVNREFLDLWLRFLSSIAMYKRQNESTSLNRRNSTPAELDVRRAARDLARNLSLHGSGVALYAALDLQKQIEMSMKLLSDPEIKSAYGARDAWQVIDQVATIDLGGAANSSRFRSMANSGSAIISWLATNTSRLRLNSPRAVLRINRSPNPRLKEFQFSGKASDSELVDACEQWLAVNGVTDRQIEQRSQPRIGAR